MRVTCAEWFAMTGDDLPRFMASSPTEISRQWKGEAYQVAVSEADISSAEAEIAAPKGDAHD